MSHLSYKRVTAGILSMTLLLALTGCSVPFGGSSIEDEKVKNLENRVNELQAKLDKEKQIADEQAQNPIVTPSTTTPTTTPGSTTPVAPVTATTPKPATDSFISIESPSNDENFYSAPVKFVGHVSPDATKITVRATTPAHTKVDEYTLLNFKAGSTTFNYGAAPQWNNLEHGTNTYIFTAYFADGSTKSTSLTAYYTEGGAEMGKPVIYLYPTKTTQVAVNVKPNGGITESIPTIGNGWNVTATPDGRITNLADQKVYPYLFWEGYAANFVTPSEGFVVAKNQVSAFFDMKLAYMGMNAKEIADFKEFWVPILGEKPYYFITFIDEASIDRYAPLTVSPKPDTTIRIFFDYKGLDAPKRVESQELKAGARNGFTLIEWGGRLYR